MVRCGTQGLDALEAVKALREFLFIVHPKDVRAATDKINKFCRKWNGYGT